MKRRPHKEEVLSACRLCPPHTPAHGQIVQKMLDLRVGRSGPGVMEGGVLPRHTGQARELREKGLNTDPSAEGVSRPGLEELLSDGRRTGAGICHLASGSTRVTVAHGQ